MASRLEEMTKAYDAPLLISGQLYDNLSSGCQGQCRQIDHLIPGNSKEDLRLYTVDVDSSELELEPIQAPLTKRQRRNARVKVRLNRNNFMETLKKGEIEVALLFESDPDLIQMRQKFSQVSALGMSI